VASVSSGRRASAWRRKLLTVGGLGAVLGLAHGAEPVHAAHDAEDLGIGLNNPFDGVVQPAAITSTRLRTATSDEAGLQVSQEVGNFGPAIKGVGGNSLAAGNAGTAVRGEGGSSGGDVPGIGGDGGSFQGGGITGAFHEVRRGGAGVTARGGSSVFAGDGGPGVLASGGSATGQAHGPGVYASGGAETVDGSKPGGTGVIAFGGNNHGGGQGIGGTGILGVGGGPDAPVVQPNAIGVSGLSGTTFGMLGQSAAGVGVRGVGYGTGAGVEGVNGEVGPGIWGIAVAHSGIIGSSDAGNGGIFSSNSGWAVHATTGGVVGVYSSAADFAFVGNGKIMCTGSGQFQGGISIAHRAADGSLRSTVTMTSPEPVVEDFGRARLDDGVARVELDPQFVHVANTTDYDVFPVPNGDCKGLYVTAKSAASFEIRELQGGTSNVEVSYRVVAKRAGGHVAGRFAAAVQAPAAPPAPRAPAPPTRGAFDAQLRSISAYRRRMSGDVAPSGSRSADPPGSPSGPPAPRR
jgi:hypothetical protein